MTAEREEAQRLLRLAARDQRAFEVLLNGGVTEDFPAAAFHAQQAVEKALKAALCLRRIEFRRTHDLLELAGRLRDAGVTLPVADDVLQRLTPYAVEFRYDDQALALIAPEDAQTLVAVCLSWMSNQIDLAQ